MNSRTEFSSTSILPQNCLVDKHLIRDCSSAVENQEWNGRGEKPTSGKLKYRGQRETSRVRVHLSLARGVHKRRKKRKDRNGRIDTEVSANLHDARSNKQLFYVISFSQREPPASVCHFTSIGSNNGNVLI